MLDVAVAETIESDEMGRPRSKNPKSIHVGVRLDGDMVAAVDAEVERLSALHPGIPFTRSMVIRGLIVETLVKGRRK